MLQGFSQMLSRSIPTTWARLPKDHQRPASGSKQAGDEAPHCSEIAAGIRLWDTYVTSSHVQGITDYQTLPIWKGSPYLRWARAFGLFPYSLPSRTEQRLSLEPLGYILFNPNNTESSDIYQCICCSCLLPQPAVSRGIKYIHYGLWYCLWYTGRGQQMLSRCLFMA